MKFTAAAEEAVPVLIVGGDGAVLVRPDRFIGWRAPTAVADPLGELAAALGQILARAVTTRPVPASTGATS